MTMRVYADTSVIGGCLDKEFAQESRALLDMARQGKLKHIVHVDKIKRFNAVNLMHGYGLIDIRSPEEVV
jgi:hypothetical protein